MNNMQNQHSESITRSMLSDVEKILGISGLFEGEMTHLSFDCPKNLREAFKQECKANGVSVCKMLQNYALAYIVVSRLKKHAYGNTLSKLVDVPLVIENLNCVQNVQSRVRRYIKKTEFYEEHVEFCGFKDCGEEVAGKGMYKKSGKIHPLCDKHLKLASNSPSEWRVLDGHLP
jgi:hypothetical protein